MTKTMVVADWQYDWFCARMGEGETMIHMIAQVIDLVDRVEIDRRKFRKWVESSSLLGLGEQDDLPT